MLTFSYTLDGAIRLLTKLINHLERLMDSHKAKIAEIDQEVKVLFDEREKKSAEFERATRIKERIEELLK